MVVDGLIQSLSAGLYAKLLTAFFEARAETLAGMRQAARDAAHDLLRNHAHGTKGAALSLGLRALADMAQRTPPVGARPEDFARWLDDLDHQFTLTHAACVRLGYLQG